MNRTVSLAGVVLLVLLATSSTHAQQFLGKDLRQWQDDLIDRTKPPTVRRSAAFAIGKIGKPAFRAVRDLVQALSDPEPSVRDAAARAIGEVCEADPTMSPPAIEQLARVLNNDDDAMVKRSAAYALGNIKARDPEVLNALLRALSDRSPAVRQNAVWALGRIEELDDLAARTLIQALEDADVAVRREAAGSIAQVRIANAHKAIPGLLSCADHPDIELKKAAVYALVKLVSLEGVENEQERKRLQDQTVPALVRAIDAKNHPEIRLNAAFALANLGGSNASLALPVLLTTLREAESDLTQEENRQLRRAVVMSLRKLLEFAEWRDIPELKEGRPGKYVAEVLGSHADRVADALKVVHADAKEGLELRNDAAVALSHMGHVPAATRALPSLLRVLENDKDVELRLRTLWAIGKQREQLFSAKDVFPTLARIMVNAKDPNSKMVRYTCAYFLGFFKGPDAPPETLMVLEEFLRDPGTKIFTGTTGGGQGTTIEKQGTGGKLKDLGKGDARVMAIQALGNIGFATYQSRPGIVDQLRTLRDDAATDPAVREGARKLIGAGG